MKQQCCGSQGKWRRLELETADGGRSLLSLPGEPVSLRISLEGRLSESHLGLVFLRLKPFLISARRWSMMQPSFCGTIPFLTSERREKKRMKGKKKLNQEPCWQFFQRGQSDRVQGFQTHLFCHSPLSVSWILLQRAASFSSQPWPPALAGFCFPESTKVRMSLIRARNTKYTAICQANLSGTNVEHLPQQGRKRITFSPQPASMRLLRRTIKEYYTRPLEL